MSSRNVLKRVTVALATCLCVQSALGNDWVDWTSGSTQSFTNSSGASGTVTYTYTLLSVYASSESSPDTNFPFGDPIKFVRNDQLPVDGSIDFTFSGVLPDSCSIFTLGNLRRNNRYTITAFNSSGNQISLVNWKNLGEYRLFPDDTAPNIWNPVTGVLIGNGVDQNNSLNIFFGLTGDTARIHVEYHNVDGFFEVLDYGLAGGSCPCSLDSDGDGTPDCKDGCPYDPNKTAPGLCGCGFLDGNGDSDGDGTPDCTDGCPYDPAKTAPGPCGCGVPDTDSDGDQMPDCADGCPADPNKFQPGECGCGIADTDSDGDGTADCNDHCPNDPNKIDPGQCGCGVPDTDVDNDGIPDCSDPAILFSFCIPGVSGNVSCPCGNPQVPAGSTKGCNNFTGGGTGGAILTGSGIPSLLGDSLVLNVTASVSSTLNVLFQGTTNNVNVRSGAGVRCVGGVLKRLYHGVAVGGAISFPNNGVPVHAQSSLKHFTIQAPVTLYYYSAYRDPGANGQPGCPGFLFGFNLSNGVSVGWTP